MALTCNFHESIGKKIEQKLLKIPNPKRENERRTTNVARGSSGVAHGPTMAVAKDEQGQLSIAVIVSLSPKNLSGKLGWRRSS